MLSLSAIGAKRRSRRRSPGVGVSHLPRKFLHFLFQNGEFLCMPE